MHCAHALCISNSGSNKLGLEWSAAACAALAVRQLPLLCCSRCAATAAADVAINATVASTVPIALLLLFLQ